MGWRGGASAGESDRGQVSQLGLSSPYAVWRSSAEREEHKRSRGEGLPGRPLQLGPQPSESFTRNWKYQDPDQWRERRDADETEQFQAYTENKQQRGGKTRIDEELESEKRRNLEDKLSHIPGQQLDSYLEYVRFFAPVAAPARLLRYWLPPVAFQCDH